MKDVATFCVSCDGTGWEPVEDQGVRRVRRCACWKRSFASRVAGIPKEFEGATIENFMPREGTERAQKAAAAWLGSNDDLYLFGSVGSGKTRLACSLANAASEDQTISARFVEVPRLIEETRCYDRETDGDVSPAVKAEHPDILILDDVGSVEKASEFTLRTLLLLYNARLRAGKRTIWTSNQTLDALAELLQDDRLTSRIAGAAAVVPLMASDYRFALAERREAGRRRRG